MLSDVASLLRNYRALYGNKAGCFAVFPDIYYDLRSGMVVNAKNTIFPPKVKKVLRIITNIWTVVILILWGYYFVKYSLWYMF